MALMKWIPLTSEDQLIEIRERSATLPQVIFKHSTRCSTSSMVLNRLERSDAPASVDFYFLDLLTHRNISNKIAEEFSVYHESPQVLLIKNGECIYDESHMGIRMDELVEQMVNRP
jgi:bacillithiol system protein YtxJ